MRLRGVELGETTVEESIRRGQAFTATPKSDASDSDAEASEAPAVESTDASKEEASS